MSQHPLSDHLTVISQVFDQDQIDGLLHAELTVKTDYMESLSTFTNWCKHPHQVLDLKQQHLLLSAEMLVPAYHDTFNNVVRSLLGTHLEPAQTTWRPTKPFDLDEGCNFADGFITSPAKQAVTCDQLIRSCLTRYNYNFDTPVKDIYAYWRTKPFDPLNWLLDLAYQIVITGAVTHQL